MKVVTAYNQVSVGTNDVTQGNGSLRPTLTLSMFASGAPGLTVPNTNGFGGSAYTLTGGGTMTLIVYAERAASDTSAVDLISPNSVTARLQGANGTANKWGISNASGGINSAGTAASDGAFHAGVGVIASGTNASYIQIDGGTATTTTLTPAATNGNIIIAGGGGATFNRLDGVSAFIDGTAVSTTVAANIATCLAALASTGHC